MNSILFAFIILGIVLVQTYLLFSFSSKVVKAGKVKNNFHFLFNLKLKSFPDIIVYNGEKIRTALFEIMYVKGQSMKHCRIGDGQYVFVTPLTEVQKTQIKTYPVLVFKITGLFNIFDSHYKLRKFVAYIDNVSSSNWNEVYELYSDRIQESVTAVEFVEDCSKKAKKMKNKDGKCILSETFDENSQKFRYSLHPVDSLYARVKYVV